MNTYLEDKIFKDESDEVKLGYLNINGLKNKAEDIDADKNLLNLDCLILAETKLSPEMEVDLVNWNISRFDFEDKQSKSPHLGMAFLSKKNPKHGISVKFCSSINLSGKAKFQYFAVNIAKYDLNGIFFYINKKPQKKDITTIIKHFKKSQLDFFIGDLNLNNIDEEDQKRIANLKEGLGIHSILYQNTRKKAHLDHVMIAKALKLQAFATSFANLYTDHSAVTLRISKNGKFSEEFVEEQIKKQGMNYLIQKEPVIKEGESLEKERAEEFKAEEDRTEDERAQKERAEEENQRQNDLLMKGTNFVLYESELDRLKPPQYLSDEIINAYMQLISEKYRDVFFFDTFFHQSLEENGFNSKRGYAKINPFTSRKWIMPINFQNCHWILLYLNLENIYNGQILMDLYDSATKMNYVYDIQTDEIRKYITFMFEKYEHSKLSKFNLVLRNVSNTLPQQHNTYDCGAFVLGYSLCLAAQKNIDFSQSNIDLLRPNMKHEFRRKALDRHCSLFSTFTKEPTRGQPKENFTDEMEQKHEKNDKNESFGETSNLAEQQRVCDEPTKFSNDGTLCWLNSLIHFFFLVYTDAKNSVLLNLLLAYKSSNNVEDASLFREQLTYYDNTLR